MTKYRLLTLTAALTFAAHAHAAPMLVDFTDSAWSAADGANSYTRTYGAVDVTLTSDSGGPLTFNSHEAPASNPEYDFLSRGGDGIGLGDDEISQGEALSVSFSSPVSVSSYYLLDLFPHEGPDSIGESARIGMDTASGASSVLENAVSSTGFFARDELGAVGVSGLQFSTADLAQFNDYALAGLRIDDGTENVSVPEPGAFWLLAAGMLGVTFVARRGARPASA